MFKHIINHLLFLWSFLPADVIDAQTLVDTQLKQ